MVKCVSILGSTGSIGRQSLDIISRLPDIRVAALTAGSSVERMARQCRQFLPQLAVMATQEAAESLAKEIEDLPVRVNWGEAGLIEAASLEDVDCVITAVVGMVGLKPTLAAIRAGKRIGLANKETLVCAGEIVMAEAQAYGAEIVPVDSEHSAIFQCLQGESAQIEKLLLTASGGPFLNTDIQSIMNATRHQALKHPNWSMGAKVTIDSASMMNKGLEMIEASWLFNMEPDKIEIVVHPQSIVHSLVQFTDGSLKAQLGAPDMRVPIQYALSYPHRIALDTKRISLPELGQLTFSAPDRKKFPAIDLAYSAHRQGGNMACIMNGANEVAVAALLEEKILFGKIPHIIEKTMQKCSFIAEPSISDIFETDACAKAIAREFI